MALVVKKFGGTSVANVERIKRVAKIVSESHEKVIVVVSAMAGVTNELVQYTRDIGGITSSEELAEYDTVISSGEQITTGLMSLALMSLGLKSRSYLGWQVPIETSCDFSQGKILKINNKQLLEDLENGIIPVIAGFQGVYKERITTLGRGGSDTTAVAIAVAVGADRCDIYTDVDGIYTADPRVVPKARKISALDYESTLEMASCGAKVIHPRAVEIAMTHNLPIRVLNTFSNDPGTEITGKKMEKIVVNGIASKGNLVMITKPRIANINQITQELMQLGVVIESISQSNLIIEDGEAKYDYSVVISSEYLDRTMKCMGQDLIMKEKISRISVIGIGVKGLLNEILNITGLVISLNVFETQISFLVENIYSDKIIRDLHTNLNLDH